MNLLMKNHKLVAILGILVILFSLNPISVFAATPMDDISNHWAKDQIQSWVDSGYIKGYPDGTFKPDNNITRAEFMTIVNNAFGFTEKAEISYSDVGAGKWYTDVVAVAKAAGYINGYPDGTMKPNDPISRQEAAVIIGKINELEANETAADEFTDAKDIPAWSKGSVGACVEAEIFTGYPNGSFQGENNIKRSESVVALSKALEYMNDTFFTAVYAISTEGFQLAFYPAIDGLTQNALTLTQGNNNVTVEAITTADKGETYTVTADLVEGQTYQLALSIEGYSFGDVITFTVLTAQEAANIVNEAIEALPEAEALTIVDAITVYEVEAAFESLTEAQKALVTTENQTKLNDAVANMEILLANAEAEN